MYNRKEQLLYVRTLIFFAEHNLQVDLPDRFQNHYCLLQPSLVEEEAWALRHEEQDSSCTQSRKCTQHDVDTPGGDVDSA